MSAAAFAPWPWLDRAGRASPLRIGALAALLAPAALLLRAALAGGLGPEPLNAAMHETGRWALRFLVLSLAVTPAGRALQWPRLFQLRRMVGLGALAWAAAHLALYAADQNWALWRVAGEIASRLYLTIGFAALAGLGALGWTSTDGWVKRLGRGWKRLHRIVFAVAALAILHAFIQARSDPSPAVLLTGLFLFLGGWRLLPARLQGGPLALAGLAAAAALATAGLEYLWYALATKLPAERVLMANLDLSHGPRPAVLAGLAALGFALLVALRRLAGARRAA